MIKMIKYPQDMELAVVVGIDAASEGPAMARERGIATTHEGLEGLRALPVYPEIGIVFDATSAYAHKVHDEALRADGKLVVDLTPAAIGPFTIPPVNMDEHLEATNVNMVRSEEHTSELQSLMRISYAVFCLKKKKKQHKI